MAITNGFEMVFNRRLIFGENKVTEIPGILNWYNKKKVKTTKGNERKFKNS